MAARALLSLAEKQRIYAAKIQGRSLSAIVVVLGCSRETTREWWRLARDHGRAALAQSCRGRAPRGAQCHSQCICSLGDASRHSADR
jgi:transposase-like protein